MLELENAKKNLAAVFDVCAFRTFLDGGFSEKVFIVTDQQRYDTIRALGFDYMDTPHIDRLVEEGVAFSDCHVTAASCVPARASLFKG